MYLLKNKSYIKQLSIKGILSLSGATPTLSCEFLFKQHLSSFIGIHIERLHMF